jgi:hypothetical protein
MKFIRKHTLARAVAVAAFSIASAATTFAQSTVYAENFGNTGASIAPNNTNIGWSLFSSTGADALTLGSVADSSAVTTVGQIESGTGNPTNIANVNSGTSLSATNGFTRINVSAANPAAGNYLFFSSEYSFDLSQSQINSISWYSARNTGFTTSVQRAAVLVNGTWYVSNASGNPSGNDGFNGTTTTLIAPATGLGSLWNELTFTTGSTLFSISGTSALLPVSGVVTGVGIYVNTVTNSGGKSFIIDSFQVTASAIPEPSTFAALAGIAVLGLAASRRRQRA